LSQYAIKRGFFAISRGIYLIPITARRPFTIR